MKYSAVTKDHLAPEVIGAFAALKRSAEIARQIAYLTGTDVIIEVNGQVMRESGTESYDLRQEQPVPPRPSNVRPLTRPAR